MAIGETASDGNNTVAPGSLALAYSVMTSIASGLVGEVAAVRESRISILIESSASTRRSSLIKSLRLFAWQQAHVDFRRSFGGNHVDLIGALDSGDRNRIAHPGIVAAVFEKLGGEYRILQRFAQI